MTGITVIQLRRILKTLPNNSKVYIYDSNNDRDIELKEIIAGKIIVNDDGNNLVIPLETEIEWDDRLVGNEEVGVSLS